MEMCRAPPHPRESPPLGRGSSSLCATTLADASGTARQQSSRRTFPLAKRGERSVSSPRVARCRERQLAARAARAGLLLAPGPYCRPPPLRSAAPRRRPSDGRRHRRCRKPVRWDSTPRRGVDAESVAGVAGGTTPRPQAARNLTSETTSRRCAGSPASSRGRTGTAWPSPRRCLRRCPVYHRWCSNPCESGSSL